MAEIRTLPLLPLRGMMVFPYMMIHLDVGRTRSMAALEQAMVDDREIMLTAQLDAEIDEPKMENLYTVGTVAEIRQIVKMQLKGVKKMLAKNGITLEATDEAIRLLGKAGYDPEFGARPVKRAIQNLVLNQLSKDIIAMKVNREHPIIIDAQDGQLIFKN